MVRGGLLPPSLDKEEGGGHSDGYCRLSQEEVLTAKIAERGISCVSSKTLLYVEEKAAPW